MTAPIHRRRFLSQATLGGAGWLLLKQRRVIWAAEASEAAGPTLQFDDPQLNSLHGVAFRNALHNLRVVNTVPDKQKDYNRTGLLLDPPGQFVRAGGDYASPWTRDASINSWNAASLLMPAVAQNTLWAVCERQANGRLIIQRDNQWWDKVIWAQAAWNHFLVTGDRDFLERAYEAVTESLTEMRQTRFNAQFGLFEGPSVLCDGIAGYPEPPYDPKVSSSFILDHPGGDKVMCLSTNCVHYQALRCAAWMAEELGKPKAVSQSYQPSAAQLRASIHRHFWMPAKSTFGYFIHGVGPLAGKLDESQEAMGLAYAILFDVADAAQVREILNTVHIQPKGIVCVWPHFARFSDERPGRHNVLVWPMASGMWAHAAAKAGSIELFERELTNIATMTNASQDIFYEIYHSVTGVPDGGWQVGRHWRSCIHQTWSATGYLRMVFHGLFGMNFERDGLRFAPTLPHGWNIVRLSGVPYRRMSLEIRLRGGGRKIASFRMDGKSIRPAVVPDNLSGRHDVEIELQL